MLHNETPDEPHAIVVRDKPSPRRINLDSLENVRREVARLYREARSGLLPLTDATRLAFLLQVLAKLHEVTTLEKRIDALEAAHGEAHET
jgi:hypothetical protein